MIKHRMYSLDSTPTNLVVHETVDPTNTLCIQNVSSTGNVYLGSSSVSSVSYGHKIFPGASFTIDMSSSGNIYAVGDSGTTVAILELEAL
jgi:hypothetical protein